MPQNSPVLTRREFIKSSAYATFAAAAAYRIPLLTALPSDPVLILGAGAAGLSAAYELMKAGIPFRVLEASNRVGGRIFTQSGFTVDGQFIERGGELIDTDHHALIGLARELGLATERIDGDKADLKATLYTYKGQVYSDEDLQAHIKPLIRAVSGARKQGAGPVTYKDAGNSEILKWDRMSLQEFLDGLRGRVSGWVREMVAIGYTGEFGRPASEISMLALVNLIADEDGGMYGPSDESMRLVGGNSSLPDALARTLEMRVPGAIEFGAQVNAIKDLGTKLRVSYVQNGMIKDIVSSRVICTLPFSVLRMVDGLDRLALSPQKYACIQKLGYGYNSKTMLEFKTKLWRQGSDKLPAYTGSLTGDLQGQDFWESSRKQKGTHGILTCFQGGDAGRNAAPELVHSMLLPELEGYLPGIRNEYVKSAVQNWNLVPTVYGSYACILAGQYGEINGAQGETELDGRMLFAGEHVSDESQGYMNGAVETGLASAQEVIKKMVSAPTV